MEKYPAISAALARGDVITFYNYYFDEWDSDSWYSMNNHPLWDDDEPETETLNEELRHAERSSDLVWDRKRGIGVENSTLIGFKEN